jgi:predicted phage baseplate assembly protein
LRGQLSAATQKELDKFDDTSDLPEVLRAALVDDLQRLLHCWFPRRDLLASGPNDMHFVAEVDDDGRGHLRFGDGELGRKPEAGTTFFAAYRIGNGPSGNVGADTIAHFVTRHTTLSGVTLQPHNPFPAQGGTLPEPLAEVKLFAPHTFRRELQRAITADDYARIAERNAKLQRAAASLRWTGSWYEAGVAIDPAGTEEASDALFYEIAGYLYRYRRMGHDLVVKAADYVPLEIVMRVCVLPHYLRGHVEAELLKVFSNRMLPDGRRGFFHPDRLTFGEGIYLSQLIAAAQAVTGVESVTVTALKRFGEEQQDEIKNGILPLSPFEIAQLDNDPSFPEHGNLTLQMQGGR